MSNDIKQRILAGALKQYEESRARMAAEKAERLALIAAAKKKKDDGDSDQSQGIAPKADTEHAAPAAVVEQPALQLQPNPGQRRAIRLQQQRDITD